MKYYFLLFVLSIAGFITFVVINKDNRVNIVKKSNLVVNPQMAIGDIFNKNFGNHQWKHSPNLPVVQFSGIVLKQDSLRLNGAQINFNFLVDEKAGTFSTDSVWWSYPDFYWAKKRAELGCFEEKKLLRSLKYLYAEPQNLMVKNGAVWTACSQKAIAELLSVDDLRQISQNLIETTPMSVLDNQQWQTTVKFDGSEQLGWAPGEKSFAFIPEVQQEIKNFLRNNYNLNSKLNYLAGNFPLDHNDSLKIFF